MAALDYGLQDFDKLFFRGFMFGRPVVGDQKFGQRYSQKTATKLAEKFARMYGVHFTVVPVSGERESDVGGRAAAGVPEFHTPPSNTGVNNGQLVARGGLVRAYEKTAFFDSQIQAWERYEESQLMSGDK